MRLTAGLMLVLTLATVLPASLVAYLVRGGLMATLPRVRAVPLLVILVLAVAAGGGALLARGLAGLLLCLREGLRRPAGGDLQARSHLERPDELGALAADADHTAGHPEAQAGELQRRMRMLALLHELGRGILAVTPLPELLRPALRGLRKLTGAGGCFLVVPEGEERTLRLLAADTGEGQEFRRQFERVPHEVPEGMAGVAITARDPAVCEDVATDPRWGQLRDALLARGIRAAVAVPLVAGGEVLGVVGLNYPAPRRFAAEEMQALQPFTDQLAIALQQARLREAAKERFRLEDAHRLKSLIPLECRARRPFPAHSSKEWAIDELLLIQPPPL